MAVLLSTLEAAICPKLRCMDQGWYRGIAGAVVAAAAVVLAVAQPALAQVRPDMVPEAALRPSGLLSAAPVSESSAAPAPTRSALSATQPDILVSPATLPVSYSAQFLGSTLQLDLPRYDSSGKYVRPRFYVGMESDSMRNWMNASGLAAEKCMLPMVRARTHMSGDGEVSGTLWMYARCTFR